MRLYVLTRAIGVAWSTYIIFVSFACTGVIWALLLSPTEKVRRDDGSRVAMPDRLSWKQELVILWRSLHEKKVCEFCWASARRHSPPSGFDPLPPD